MTRNPLIRLGRRGGLSKYHIGDPAQVPGPGAWAPGFVPRAVAWVFGFFQAWVFGFFYIFRRIFVAESAPKPEAQFRPVFPLQNLGFWGRQASPRGPGVDVILVGKCLL